MPASAITIHLLEIPQVYKNCDAVISKLAPNQLMRFNRLGNQRAIVFCASRLLLQHVLGAQGQAINILERDNLAPLLRHKDDANSPMPLLSISHTANVIAIATAPVDSQASGKQNRLGIDVETINIKRRSKIADYFCNAEQLTKINDLADSHQKQAYTTQLWTQKEAYFKAQSESIFNPLLKKVSFNPASKSRMDMACFYLCAKQNHFSNEKHRDFEIQMSCYCNFNNAFKIQTWHINAKGDLSHSQHLNLEPTTFMTVL